MKFSIFLKPVIFLACFLFASSASAVLFKLNHTNFSAGTTNESLTTTIDGITLTMTAFTLVNDGAGDISSASQLTSPNGVYVSSSNSTPDSGNVGVTSGNTDGTNLDGGNSIDDPDEGILFSFSQAVSLDYVNFDSFGSSDDFNLSRAQSLVPSIPDFDSLLHDIGSLETDGTFISPTSEDDAFNFQNVIGQQFLIWADGTSDSFRVDRIEVSAVPAQTPLVLMAVGLVALISRRKTNDGSNKI